MHLLSPTASNISESSVETIINSPSPNQFRQGFGCEPSSDRATEDENASTVHLLPEDATNGSEAPHTISRDRSLHDVPVSLKHGTNDQTWPLDASKSSHVYHNPVAPDSLEKVSGTDLRIGEDTIPSFDFMPPGIHKGRKDFFKSITIVIALYSTVMSGLWLVIAACRPHWGHRISSHGIVKPDNASLISTLLAKSIEISLGAAFVTFLGQKLSQRAFFQPSKGISIAEMSMRAWVVQPGTIFAHWNILRNGISSWLGLATFFVAWMAMLYTTASDALGKHLPHVLGECISTSSCFALLDVLRIG